jgi:hypothetical protein
MAKLGPYEVHPFADAFPLIDGDEFGELVMDIKRNGLREPIILNHDRSMLIDGRNRWRACEAAGQDPVFEVLPERYTEPMILDLIVSKNLARRQLNPGQKAFCALDYKERYAKAIQEQEQARKVTNPANQHTQSGATPADRQESRYERESATRAAKITGSSGRSVARATAIKRDAPDLAEQVRSGAITLDAADKQRKERLKAEPRPDPAPKPSQVMLTLRTHKGDAVPYPQPQAKATFNDPKRDGISWAQWSWNPVTGCLHGCDYCYAREIATNAGRRLPRRLHAAVPPRAPRRPGQHRHPRRTPRRPGLSARVRLLHGRPVRPLGARRVDRPGPRVDARRARSGSTCTLTKFPARYVGLEMPPGPPGSARPSMSRSASASPRTPSGRSTASRSSGCPGAAQGAAGVHRPVDVRLGRHRRPDRDPPAGRRGARVRAAVRMGRPHRPQAREAGCKVHLKPNLVNGRPGMQIPDEYPEVDRKAGLA